MGADSTGGPGQGGCEFWGGCQAAVSEVEWSWQLLWVWKTSCRRELGPLHAACTFQTGGWGCTVQGSQLPGFWTKISQPLNLSHLESWGWINLPLAALPTD